MNQTTQQSELNQKVPQEIKEARRRVKNGDFCTESEAKILLNI